MNQTTVQGVHQDPLEKQLGPKVSTEKSMEQNRLQNVHQRTARNKPGCKMFIKNPQETNKATKCPCTKTRTEQTRLKMYINNRMKQYRLQQNVVDHYCLYSYHVLGKP